MSQSIQLFQPTLGLDPYIVIECVPDDDPDSAGFKFQLNAGGGVTGKDEMAMVLLLLVEQLTGVDTDFYVEQVNIIRRAAGLDPLTASTP